MKTPNRATDLDLLKTLLVIGMVGAHVVQLITFRARPEAAIFAEYANLVSFPGFLFAFGIGLGLPKPEGRKRSLWRQLRPSLLLLLAVYASSFAFALLVDRKKLDPQLIFDVVTMQRLFGWSEFLATFFMLSLLTLVARPALLAIGRNPWLLVVATLACLATTFYTTGAIVPLLPTLVSHTGFANFPLLPYLPWFLLGIWYGSHPVRAWHFVPALAITGYLYWVTIQTGQFPNRFPPTILWIVGPAAILIAYLWLCRFIAARVSIPNVLLTPGRHVLSFLVLSNIGFFATRYFMGKPVRSSLTAALVTVGVLVLLSAGWYSWQRLRKATRPQPAPAPAR
ncbi:hypothetical protein ASC89_16530 [Devosia sp. Root413D1]|uniref:hypothetical protein n=1 Tax=Devosia sp. Root413D1 TaxID=1736531 RepID=UPI0006FBCD33|nr:hypothetical protein [Devosia sp. Root413D1]KQW78386.1 hypothetical protein ASC89_16530 [Devosia sp. Root413D1]